MSSESGEVLHASVKTKGTVHKEESKAGEDNVKAKNQDSEISQEFREQLTRVYQAYLPVKNAFVASNPHEVAMYAEKLNNVLNSVNMKLLAGKSHVDWMDQLNVMKESLDQMEMDHDMQNQRMDFANFNTVFHESIKQFGLTDVIIYYQYCPMAVDGKGAYWLSDTKEISNPYFGDEMPKCGETRETLKY